MWQCTLVEVGCDRYTFCIMTRRFLDMLLMACCPVITLIPLPQLRKRDIIGVSLMGLIHHFRQHYWVGMMGLVLWGLHDTDPLATAAERTHITHYGVSMMGVWRGCVKELRRTWMPLVWQSTDCSYYCFCSIYHQHLQTKDVWQSYYWVHWWLDVRNHPALLVRCIPLDESHNIVRVLVSCHWWCVTTDPYDQYTMKRGNGWFFVNSSILSFDCCFDVY